MYHVVSKKGGSGQHGHDGCDVLVVDDDPELVELLLSYFSVKRLAARGLVRSKDYVKDIRAAKPRLVLLDVKLPGVDGYHLCSELKESYGADRIKVVMVTARPKEEVEQHAAASHADGYLLKPFSLSELDGVIEDRADPEIRRSPSPQ